MQGRAFYSTMSIQSPESFLFGPTEKVNKNQQTRQLNTFSEIIRNLES
jgi:hypothetical protein